MEQRSREPAHDPPTGIMGELPNWVWDVVMAIELYEDEHPSSLRCPILTTEGKPVFISGHKDSRDFGGWVWCIGHIYGLIPQEVRDTAAHIRRYRNRG